MSRIVQIVAATEGESPGLSFAVLFALDDEGCVWRFDQSAAGSPNSLDWERVPGLPVPGEPR